MDLELPNSPTNGKLVEQRINTLLVPKTNEELQSKCSPSLNDLKNGPSRVKQLSKMFDDQSKATSEPPIIEINSDSDRNSFTRKATKFFKPKFLSKIVDSLTNSPAIVQSRTEGIISEILQKELAYIENLQRGIEVYANATTLDHVPTQLCNQKFRLFGNIDDIVNLHKQLIYPELLRCNGDVKLIAELFIKLVKEDYFYPYIIYAINHKTADQLLSVHMKFFNQLQRESKDMHGVHSFCIQPIQKLPRYKIFLEEIIKELGKEDMTGNKDNLAACSIAIKNIQRFLTRLNEALTLNDIIETREFPVSLQFGLITVLQKEFGSDVNEPTMLLLPQFSSHHGYRSPINIFKLGKFIYTLTSQAYEHFNQRSMQCKVFLFERCIIYTKIIDKGTLGFRDSFHFNANFFLNDGKSKHQLQVGDMISNRFVTFSSDQIDTMIELKRLIREFYDPRTSGDSALGSEVSYPSTISQTTQLDDFIVTSEDDESSENDVCGSDFEEIKSIANSCFYIKSPVID